MTFVVSAKKSILPNPHSEAATLGPRWLHQCGGFQRPNNDKNNNNNNFEAHTPYTQLESMKITTTAPEINI